MQMVEGGAVWIAPREVEVESGPRPASAELDLVHRRMNCEQRGQAQHDDVSATLAVKAPCGLGPEQQLRASKMIPQTRPMT